MINWKHQARMRMEIQGFHQLDYAEDQNRIVAVVERAGDRQRVINALENEVGIPETRFTVETGPRFVSTSEIDEEVRPVVGGLIIRRSATLFCTLGFNVKMDGIPGFLTNAHCTPSVGTVDNVAFYQDTIEQSDSLGAEHTDPSVFFNNGCGDSDGCRWADAAFFEYEGTVNYNHGVLANIDEDTSDGSCAPDNTTTIKTIDSGDPDAEITQATRSSPPAMGETVYHLGVTTAQTWGEIASTNDDHESGDVTFLDQYRSECQNCTSGDRIADGGDSGGPVYRFTTYCGSSVKLDGIRHGTNADDPGTKADEQGQSVVFSPIDLIEDDLGSLDIEH